jgi:hypothetical protein
VGPRSPRLIRLPPMEANPHNHSGDGNTPSDDPEDELPVAHHRPRPRHPAGERPVAGQQPDRTVVARRTIRADSGRTQPGLVRRFRKRGTAGGVLLVTVGLVVTDAPLGITSEYWAKHSLASGMLSGLLLLLLALMVIEDFVARREERAWRHVAAMATKNLAYSSGALGKSVAELVGVSIDDDPDDYLDSNGCMTSGRVARCLAIQQQRSSVS